MSHNPNIDAWIMEAEEEHERKMALALEEIEGLRGQRDELLQACKYAQEIIRTARNYFPKSIQHRDKFSLENTNAAIGKALENSNQCQHCGGRHPAGCCAQDGHG